METAFADAKMRSEGSAWRRLGLLMPLVALMLAGCYESDVAVIDKGEMAAIAGKYACRLLIDNEDAFDLTVAEATPGTYRFAATDIAGTVKLKRLAGERYLLQLSDDSNPGTWYYAYGEPTGAAGFRALYPKWDDKALPNAAMKTYAVRFFDVMGREDATGTTVKAEPAELLRFLSDPGVHGLKPWFTCERA